MTTLEIYSEKALATDAVQRLECELLKMPQADIVTTHKFLPGIYERTVIIPPNTVATGARHKTPYTVRLEQGSIVVNTDAGMKVLTAPCEFDSPAGVKRVVFSLSESVIWTDAYVNEDDCQDIPTLEDRLYETDGLGLGENRRTQLLDADRADYSLFLSQIGLTADEAWTVANHEADQIPMPPGFDVEVRSSAIHGLGLFALRDFHAGEYVSPGRINGMRTPAGRYINHSTQPNVVTANEFTPGDLGAVAARHIFKGQEILLDYRNSFRVNFGISIQGEASCQAG